MKVAHEDITDRRRREEERAHRRLREAAARAKAHEQRQIGRELHDRLAHTMVLVHHSLELYEVYGERDPEKAQQKLELAKRMAAEAIEQTRDLSRTLNSGEAAGGLEEALSELLSQLVPLGMTHELSVAGEEEDLVSAEVREQLFLVLREAVRNAVSHSGASKLSVEIWTDRERIVGVVEDDGRGFDRKAPEQAEAGGLAYMAQRASRSGGACSIESSPGEGTRVETSFPLEGAEPSPADF
jgi:signal transduction histidine kinase